jgi:hypothetical protein
VHDYLSTNIIVTKNTKRLVTGGSGVLFVCTYRQNPEKIYIIIAIPLAEGIMNIFILV